MSYSSTNVVRLPATEGALATPVALRRGSCGLGFAFLVLLNAVLFIRPSELLPSLDGVPFYNVIIVLCIAASLPVLLKQISWSYLRSQPSVFCVVSLLPAIVLSHLTHGNFWSAQEGGTIFGKVVLFYLLLTGLVNRPHRLRSFLVWTVVFIIAIAAIAELDRVGIVKVSGISTAAREIGVDASSGETVTVDQLYGPGIFNDPNDFAMILAAGMVILLHFAIEATSWSIRIGLAAAGLIPTFAFALTRSRGGFLSLAGGMSILAVAKFGRKRSVPLLALAMPLMLALFSGRMTNINISDEGDTAYGRVMIWRDGFAELRLSPIFGIGFNNYADCVGHVAHNSVVHAFTELGLVGGMLFTSAFCASISVLAKRVPAGVSADQRELARWRPAILAAVSGYAIGLSSLSRVYTVSTYLILGIAAAYCVILRDYAPDQVPGLSARYCVKLATMSVGCLMFFNVLVRIL